MGSLRIRRSAIVIAAAIAVAALALPLASGAAGKAPVKLRAITGAALHVLGTSAQLTAVIDPNGIPATYYFQWGPTAAYGSQTPSTSVGNGTAKVKVGQSVVGLRPGTTYHFRVVATNAAGEVVQGRDKVFAAVTAAPLKFTVVKNIQALVGSPFMLTGTLTGLNNGNHPIALQASPYPFLEPFASIGLPGATNAAGSFAFRVANLSSNTQFRVITLDPRPIYSPVVTALAGVHVTLHVRRSSQAGLVRLYGTVTPAVPGARVFFQLHRAVRPQGKSEVTAKFVSLFSTTVKKATRTTSRFSLVVSVRKSGRYRALVKPPTGQFSSGNSPTVVLHAPPAKKRKA
jgi:hypothetical protein